jgi:hypothetical protein
MLGVLHALQAPFTTKTWANTVFSLTTGPPTVHMVSNKRLTVFGAESIQNDDEVTEKIHNEKLQNLYSSHNTVTRKT